MKRQVLEQRTPDDARRPVRGRDGQLDQIADAVRACAADGERRTLLLTAPVGTGKTRLLLEASAVAEGRGFSVVDGIVDRPELSVLGLPVVRQPHAVAPDANRLSWLTAQFERHVETQLRRGPVLVTVDDLHWADPLTVAALRHLMTRLDDRPVVWIFAMRAEDLDSPNGLLLGAMAGAPRTEWLAALEPLSDDVVTEVVTDLLDATPDADVASLCECMGGNPRAIVDLVRGLVADEALRVSAGIARLAGGPLPSNLLTVAIDQHSRLPQRFLAAVRERLGRLDPVTQQVLQVAAVLGRRFGPQDLADMLSASPATMLKPLQEALNAGLLGCLPNAFEFRREPVWRAVLDTVPALMRGLLHKQAADMLPASDEAAVHLLHCGPAGDSRSVDAIRAAAGRLLDRSPETAAALAVRGLEVASEDPELTRTAVAALTRSGQLDRAIGLARPGQDLAIALLLKGDVARAARIGAGPARLAALSYAHQTAAEKAATGWDGVSLTVRAAAMWRRGRLDDALATVQKAVSQESPWYFDPQWTLTWMQIRMRLLAEATETLRSSEDSIDSSGAKGLASVPVAQRSWLPFAQGHLAEAEAEATAGIALAAETQMPLYEPHLRAVLVLSALRRGDVATAADRLQAFETLPWSSLRIWVTVQVAAARSGPEAALAVLELVRADAARRRELLLADPAAAAWCVRTALSGGDEAFAEILLASAEELGIGNHARALLHRDVFTLAAATEQCTDRWARASATEDLGVLLADYDRDEAVAALDRAMEFYDSLGAAWDSARVRSRLRRLGIRRRHWHHAPRPATGWGSLTGTEEKVARLVAHGLTNRQVAAELFVSPHTVGFHLRQIYRKLAIQSRVDLARIAP